MMGALPSNSDRLNTCPWPEEHLPHDHAKHRTRSILARLMGQEVALAGVAAVLNMRRGAQRPLNACCGILLMVQKAVTTPVSDASTPRGLPESDGRVLRSAQHGAGSHTPIGPPRHRLPAASFCARAHAQVGMMS